jgi:hypothetical protein
MTSLSEYVEMEEGAREGIEPFVHFAAREQRHVLAIVGAALVRATESRRDFWLALRADASDTTAALSATAAVPAAVGEPVAVPPAAPAPAAALSAHQAVTEQLLRLCGFTSDPEFFKQSLRDFVVQRNVESREGGAGE